MAMRSNSLGRRLRRLFAAAPGARWRVALQRFNSAGPLVATDIEIVRELPPQRVLVMAPHPDDEIIGPGGCLAHHVEAGSEVTVAYLTDGGGIHGDREALVECRRREAEAVGRMMGFQQVFWSYPDTRLDPKLAEADLRRLLDRLRPDSIFLTSCFERHVDHYAANALLARALEDSDSAATIWAFEVWDSLPSPSCVVDISRHLERKLEAMSTYETPLRYTDFAQLIRHRNALHHLLHVDSRRMTPEGMAEAFLRSSVSEFLTYFAHWDALLRDQANPLTAHLDSL